MINFKHINGLKNDRSITLQDDKILVVAQEMAKMLMCQTSLKRLFLLSMGKRRGLWSNLDIPFTTYPGAIDCLKNLSELTCNSDIDPEIFHQLPQLCHNMQSLNIHFEHFISNANGLSELISVQQNLKNLSIYQTFYNEKNLTGIISTLTTLSNVLIKLDIKENIGHIIILIT